MDQIDRQLHEAWGRIGARLQRDRAEALARSRRRLTNLLSRPPRAWCLCLRASDTRLTGVESVMNSFRAVDRGEPHQLILSGKLVRRLCKPVRIDWPGMDWSRAAAKLGRHEATIRLWIERGILRATYVNATSMSKRGRPVPVVWSPTPLDPGSNHGGPPDPVWGTLWQTLWERMPEEFGQVVQRVPLMRPFPRPDGRIDHRRHGWLFTCPGRFRPVALVGDAVDDPDDPPAPDDVIEQHGVRYVRRPCGRRVRRLFAPQTIWTLGRAQGGAMSLPMPDDAPLVGDWHPGLDDPVRAAGPRSFACHQCWRVQNTSLVNRSGWNQFVTYLSGGLLYGHEVARPDDVAPQRKRRYVPHPRPAPRRMQVQALLLEGLTYKQIARRIGISYGAVQAHVGRTYKAHGVHGRAELVKVVRGREPSPGAAEGA